jgi:hypothetical protein
MAVSSPTPTEVPKSQSSAGGGLVWKQAARAAGLPAAIFTLAVCVLGGLLVGVMVRIFGDHSGISKMLALTFTAALAA